MTGRTTGKATREEATTVRSAGTAGEPEVLIVAHVGAWRAWLDANEGSSDGTWLLLARKGVLEPTSLSYAQALDEALCSGWIDGQTKRVDEHTYRQRYTPRRTRSLWSARNVTYVARLAEEGRMRSRGDAEVARAKGDGRWGQAYAGPATMAVPVDLQRALDASPGAASAFAALSGQARYAHLFALATARTQTTRERRLGVVLARLEPGSAPRGSPQCQRPCPGTLVEVVRGHALRPWTGWRRSQCGEELSEGSALPGRSSSTPSLRTESAANRATATGQRPRCAQAACCGDVLPSGSPCADMARGPRREGRCDADGRCRQGLRTFAALTSSRGGHGPPVRGCASRPSALGRCLRPLLPRAERAALTPTRRSVR